MGCLCTHSPKKTEENQEIVTSTIKEEESTMAVSRTTFYKTAETGLSKHSTDRTYNASSFSSCLFDVFNKIRTQPKLFAEIIEQNKQFVFEVKDNKILFLKEGTPKIKLKKGVSAFDSCAQLLRKMQPLNALDYSKRLEIKVPERKEDWVKAQVIKHKIEKKKQEVLDDFGCFSFHYDLGSIDPLVSAVLQIVDDSNFDGFRRENILSEDFCFVGITDAKQNGKNICYVSFS